MSSSLLLQQYPVCRVHLIRMVLWWEVSGRTAECVASVICSKQHVIFFCSCHQAFSLCVLLTSIWCIHTLVWTQPQPQLFFFLWHKRNCYIIIINIIRLYGFPSLFHSFVLDFLGSGQHVLFFLLEWLSGWEVHWTDSTSSLLLSSSSSHGNCTDFLDSFILSFIIHQSLLVSPQDGI